MNTARTTNIVLADDHRIVRQGLHALLKAEPDFNVIGEAGDGLEALELVKKLNPDVVVLDLMMPGLNGLEVARQINKQKQRTKVIILS
ncbi:MAG: response regulator transcription factor, partial [Actinomycetota bacterium]